MAGELHGPGPVVSGRAAAVALDPPAGSGQGGTDSNATRETRGLVRPDVLGLSAQPGRSMDAAVGRRTGRLEAGPGPGQAVR